MSAEINLKSTKQDMLEAINELKAELSKKEQMKLNPEKIRSDKETQQASLKTDAIVKADIHSLIAGLKTEITKELNAISEKIISESEKYRDIVKSIVVKQKELQDIFGLEAKASELAVLIETQHRRKEEFDEEMNSRKAALDNELNQTKSLWETEKKKFSEDQKEQKLELEKQRKRENDEFLYNLKRTRELEQNKYNDELQKVVRDIASKKEQFDIYQKSQSEELSVRESAVAEREKKLNELQARVESFPEELKKAVDGSVKDSSAKLNADFSKNEALLLKGFEGERNVLMAKIEAYDKSVKEQSLQIAKLQQMQEKAYEKVQDIATKAVSGASDRFNQIYNKQNSSDKNGE